MSLSKFFPLEELEAVLAEEREKNKTIALADGGFDLIHVGHIRFLERAKKTADILAVALYSDGSPEKLKGRKRPILDERSRIRIIASFECVDYVTLFDEQTVDNLLLTLKPDVHLKSVDYTSEIITKIR